MAWERIKVLYLIYQSRITITINDGYAIDPTHEKLMQEPILGHGNGRVPSMGEPGEKPMSGVYIWRICECLSLVWTLSDIVIDLYESPRSQLASSSATRPHIGSRFATLV